MHVDVSGKVFSIPRHCACCGGAPDAELDASATRTTGVKVVRSQTHTWTFPFCSACVHHVRTWNNASATFQRVAIGGAALGVVALFVVNIRAAVVVAAIGLILGLVLAARIRKQAVAQCSADCACAAQAVQFLGWDGTLNSFEFASRTYGAVFLIANRAKLVNLTPEGRLILEADHQERLAAIKQEHEERIAEIRAVRDERLAEIDERQREASERLAELRLAADAEMEDWAADARAERLQSRADEESDDGATTAASRDEARENLAFMKWVAAIEAAKGPAGRRAAMDAGVLALTRQEMKDKLMLEGSRIEVQAALDKADGLKTPAAKLRTLRSALDGVRSDSVPDELQAQQIQWLEDAIADVERGS
jgi:hypothetical protein